MIPGDVPVWIVLPYLFVVGACVGSFLNVCIYRLPRHENIWRAWAGVTSPPSSCPTCRTRISPRDNIPIFGWLMLGGRCRTCRNAISPRYPALELLNGLLWVALYAAIVPAGWHATLSDSALWTPFFPVPGDNSHHLAGVFALHVRYVYFLILAEALFVATFIDFDLWIIPDSVTLPAIAVGVLGAAIFGPLALAPVWTQDPSVAEAMRPLFPWAMPAEAAFSSTPRWIHAWPWLHGLAASAAGLVVGGGVVWLIRVLGQFVLRREAMGFGDVVLMAAIGSFVGWQASILVFFIAPVIALIAVCGMWLFRGVRELPYGPYLSLATLLVILGWQPIWAATERVFGLGLLLIPLAAIMTVMMFVSLVLVQGVKRLLGISDPVEDAGEWTSADQLAFYANRTAQSPDHPLRTTAWPGMQSGRGNLFTNHWAGRSSR